ncbi:protein of unknown function [Trichlorobacter ammonificans]|uniref:Uncharacterized protein n=1 Tax=Trichlorobacter ammonificans TaxID=2916410 RepID=A0ABN8HLR9_9BACT|nr:protein of unknown function [Trichlorobacter ammonificans]
MFVLAEGQGFEPWVPCGTLDFESSTFDLSDTPPEKKTARSGRPEQFYTPSAGKTQAPHC